MADSLEQRARRTLYTNSQKRPKRRAPSTVKRAASVQDTDSAVSAILNGAAGKNARETLTSPKAKEPGFWDNIGEGLSDFVNTPVIKTAIDVLSTGNYASANIADQAIEGGKRVLNGDIGGVGQVLGAPVVGIGKGLSAGIAGNQSDAMTYGKLMDKNLGEVSEGDTAGAWTRGIAGFVGDVALDPATYLTLGGAVAVKGGVRASQAFKSASKAKQSGENVSAEPLKYNTKGEAFRGGFKESRKTFKQTEKENKQFRRLKKDMKKGRTSDEQIGWLLERVNGLEPAIAKKMVDEVSDVAKVLDKNLEAKKPELAAAITAPDDVADAIVEANRITPDTVDLTKIPAKIPDEAPVEKFDSSFIEPPITGVTEPRLSEFKAVTEGQKLVEKVANIRATPSTPKAAKSTELDEGKMADYFMANQFGSVPLKNGKEIKLTQVAKDYANPQLRPRVLAALSPDFLSRFTVDTVDEAKLPEGTVGDMRAIARDIAAGKIDSKQFEELAGTSDPKKVAAYVSRIAKTEDFKTAQKKMRPYNTGSRLGLKDPTVGVSGTALSARPSERFSAADIISSKSPATKEEARAYLEAKYTQVATELSSHRMAPEMRKIADEIFYAAVGVQKLPGGDAFTTKGARQSGLGADKGAKFTGQWNTQANIWHISNIVREVRAIPAAAKSPQLRDIMIMAILKDVDNRLRLAGIDHHLSNMALSADKTVVRLSASDVFEAMPRSARMKYLWGTGKGNAINEVLPTTALDLAEVLIRSMTKLTPEGRIDWPDTMAKAMDTLTGTYGKNYGGRVIGRNLDNKTKEKAWSEIVMKIAGRESQTFKAFQKATLHNDKKEIVDALKASDPLMFDKVSKARFDSTTVALMNTFVKGFKDGNDSVIGNLVNLNMRNAAIHGGNVGTKVSEAGAEHLMRITGALNNGNVSNFLHELVVKPPFKYEGATDPATKVIRDEAQAAVQRSVASPAEVKHFTATAKNVANATKPVDLKIAAKNNAEAYQKNPELVEARVKMDNGTATQVDVDKAFDLSMREVNADVLARAFGVSRFFNPSHGMPVSYSTVSNSAHAATHIMTGYHNIFKTWAAKGIGKEELRVAFKEMQNGTAISPTAVELTKVLHFMFTPAAVRNGKEVPVSNFLTRNTVGPDHFNKILKSVGFGDDIRVNPDATPQEMANAWRDWKIENPVDFFSKMMHAQMKTAEDISIGASFSKNFGVATARPGYRRVTDTSKKNEFLLLIDKDLFYPTEVINEMTFINRHMLESRSFKPGTGMHTFVTQVMDPVIGTLKLTQTTLKPGHHVMSAIGDGFRNHLAGTKAKNYGQIARIMHTNFGAVEGMDDFNKWANVKEMVHGTDVGRNTNQRFETMVIGGKQVKVGHEDLMAVMKARGVALPPHLGSTDVDELADFDQLGNAGNMISRGVQKAGAAVDRLANPNHGKYSINAFTAHRDIIFRGAMFMYFAQSRSFKTLEEAADYAAIQVRKWAPTAADLSGFESKYARRMLFYYTWLRGMTPRIIEGALTKPGIALVPSKAMFNMALSNGLDPSTIGDPFPEGTLFPSWYQEKVLGPQWENDGDLWGFNPTGPVMDVFNSLGSGITPKDMVNGAAIPKFGQTVLNMSTPWFKTPTELTTGVRLDGGAPIPDKTEYLQDMIGPVRVGSRITGKDFSSPGLDAEGNPAFANRTSSKYRDGLGEDAGSNAIHEIMNYLTGLQFTNYTSDQAENSAEFQEKDRLSQEKRDNARFGG